jgi:hypothetical protein
MLPEMVPRCDDREVSRAPKCGIGRSAPARSTVHIDVDLQNIESFPASMHLSQHQLS